MSSKQDTKKEVQRYFIIFAALLTLTVITVAISGLKVGVTVGIIIAMIVAATKASLVASFFMHLVHEQKLVYLSLILTGFFLIAMIVLIVFSNSSVPQGTENLNFKYAVQDSDKNHSMAGDHSDSHH
ncbi:MAG: cytochrome C oxidase subunit IV family protein [Candidatus Omnitrophica bacterium]|nr:cytochrome C oxidase subunit IV family protein [Candidatus Omnitrophota bacterium]